MTEAILKNLIEKLNAKNEENPNQDFKNALNIIISNEISKYTETEKEKIKTRTWKQENNIKEIISNANNCLKKHLENILLNEYSKQKKELDQAIIKFKNNLDLSRCLLLASIPMNLQSMKISEIIKIYFNSNSNLSTNYNLNEKISSKDNNTTRPDYKNYSLSQNYNDDVKAKHPVFDLKNLNIDNIISENKNSKQLQKQEFLSDTNKNNPTPLFQKMNSKMNLKEFQSSSSSTSDKNITTTPVFAKAKSHSQIEFKIPTKIKNFSKNKNEAEIEYKSDSDCNILQKSKKSKNFALSYKSPSPIILKNSSKIKNIKGIQGMRTPTK